jgi:hypothetical protein
MIKNAINIVMNVIVLGVAVWLIIQFHIERYFHLRFFFYLWLIIPIIAIWMNSEAVKVNFTILGFHHIRTILLYIEILLSILLFLNYDTMRDYVGYNYIEGYSVQYHEDGNGNLSSSASTGHWYSGIGLSLLTLVFLVFLICFPLLIWILVPISIKERLNKNTTSYSESTKKVIHDVCELCGSPMNESAIVVCTNPDCGNFVPANRVELLHTINCEFCGQPVQTSVGLACTNYNCNNAKLL